MKHYGLGLLIALLVCLAGVTLVLAQDETPETPETPTEAVEVPAMPEAPYVLEDVEAIEANIEASRTARTEAAERLTQARAAATEPDLSEEEQTAREARVEELVAEVAALDEQIRVRRAALDAAREGPTRAQLDARREYDRLVALAQRAARDLIADPRQEDGQVEGVLARRIRESEEEFERAHRLSMEYDPTKVNFDADRVYQRLSEIEKLEHEMRWADQSFGHAIREYETLRTQVFEAYREYEQRAFEGLRAITRARSEVRPGFSNTPAARLEIPELPMADADLTRLRDDISRRLSRRNGSLGQDPRHVVTQFEGVFREVQERIDLREDFKDSLAREAERVKDIIAQGSTSTGESDELVARADMADYQRLGVDIKNLEEELKQLKYQLERLKVERGELENMLEDKRRTEREVETLVNDFQQRFDELEIRWDETGEAWRAMSTVERSLKPRILLFTLEEELAARRERLSAARRDTRHSETELEIEDRRIERIQQRIADVESIVLPELKRDYYEAIAVTVGIRAVKVAGVFLVAWLILWFMKVIGTPLIERIVRRADGKSEFSADEQQRARTLMTVFMTTARVVVYITAIMFAIAQFDVDYGPLLVAAGGVSLAVGFGAQTLVRDFFAGFFILLEGQYSIGDVVDLNGRIGTVENLNLRTTVLRSLDGSVHTIPNGEISRTTNMTKLWSRAVVNIDVAYEENTDDIAGIMESVAHEMREDENWGRKLIEHILLGLAELGESGVTMQILLKTRAGEQWGVAREYRRRIKLKFDELGVEIPWPQRVISYKSYADQDEQTRRNAERGKKARILRYVRRTRGELTEEEAALANMSVEERDRAETLARHEADRVMDKAEAGGGDAREIAARRKAEGNEDENLTDAERLARRLAKQEIKERTMALSAEELEKRKAADKAAEETDSEAKQEDQADDAKEDQDKKKDS